MAAPAATGNVRVYPRPTSRDDFEIAIICALPREMDAVELLVDEFWDETDQAQFGQVAGDTNTYQYARIGKFNIVLVTLANIGKVEACTATQCLATSYLNISLVLLVGVCGGMSFSNVGGKREEIFLGDVVISSIVNQYDRGRQLSGSFLPKSEVEDTLGRPNNLLRKLLTSFETVRARDKLQSQAAMNLVQLQDRSCQNPRYPRYTYPGRDKDRLFEPSYEHKHRSPSSDCLACAQGSICESSWKTSCDDIGCDVTYLVQDRMRYGRHDQPMVFIGRVGSADTVVRSAKHRDAHAEKGTIALEMEGAGAWDVLPCLVIKGVCDYADSHKNKGWQHYAAATAASVAKAFLGHYKGTGRITGNASKQDTIPTPAPFLNAPFQPDDDFVEREEIMTWLQTELKNKGTRAALVGFGGVGKSRLVIRYARNTQRNFPQTYVLWVYAGTQELFISSFRDIAQELSLDGWDDTKADVLRLVLNWLRPGNRDWLMILDNADDIDVFDPKPDERKDLSNGAASLRAMEPLDFLRRCQNGNIVITSRSEKVVRRLGVGSRYRRVEPMLKGQARELLRYKLATEEDESGEEDLVDALDCIPLAITHAAAYINRLASTGRTSVRVYLKQLRESESNQAILLNDVPEDGASGPVFTTWIMTYGRIQKERPSASDLLSLLSFFYHCGIPEWVLEKYYGRLKLYHPHTELPQNSLDPLAEDIAMLCSYSLVTVVPMVDNLDNQHSSSRSLQMHALVHACTRHWARSNDSDKKWICTYIHLLDKEHPDLFCDPMVDFEDWALCRDLLPHVDYLTESNGLDDIDDIHMLSLVQLFQHSATYSSEIGMLERSERLLIKALKVAETRLCEGHCATSEVIGKIKEFDKYETKLQNTIVSAANRLFRGQVGMLAAPAENLTALKSYHVATDMLVQDANQHTDELQQALLLPMQETAWKESSPNVLVERVVDIIARFIANAPSGGFTTTVIELVMYIIPVLGYMGNLPQQGALYGALLERRLRLPEERWSKYCRYTRTYLVVRYCEILDNQEKYEQAEVLLQELHFDYSQMLLDDESFEEEEYLAIFRRVLFNQLKNEEGEQIDQELFELRGYSDNFSSEEYTLSAEGYMSYKESHVDTLLDEEKYDEASSCFRQILGWRKELQILEHPDTVDFCEYFVEALLVLERYEEAEDILKLCIDLMQRKFKEQVGKRTFFLDQLLNIMEGQGKDEGKEYYDYRDQLAKLEGWYTSESEADDASEEADDASEEADDASEEADDASEEADDASEEADDGSNHSFHENQALNEGDSSLKHYSEELQAESTSTIAGTAAPPRRITIRDLIHDCDTMDLASQSDDQPQQWNANSPLKLLLNQDSNTPTGPYRQLEESSVERPGFEIPLQGQEGGPLPSTTSAIQGQRIEVPTQRIQMSPRQESHIVDEPEDLQIQVTSVMVESEVTKRKRADTGDSVVTNGSTSQEKPSQKIIRTE